MLRPDESAQHRQHSTDHTQCRRFDVGAHASRGIERVASRRLRHGWHLEREQQRRRLHADCRHVRAQYDLRSPADRDRSAGFSWRSGFLWNTGSTDAETRRLGECSRRWRARPFSSAVSSRESRSDRAEAPQAPALRHREPAPRHGAAFELPHFARARAQFQAGADSR